MEILPSVLTWLSGVVNVAKKEISDATTDTTNFLDKKSYQVTEAVQKFVSDSTGLPPDVFSRDLFANPIRASERTFPTAPLAGTFIAKNSPFWNPRLAEAAAESLRKGAKREDIFFDTETWVNPPDGIWRQELDDSVMIINPAMINSSIPVGSPAYYLERVIEHNDLFKAAPHLKKTITFLTTDPSKELGGKFYPGANVIEVNGKDLADVRSILIHEVGHGIQRPAGMATGGSWKNITPEMKPHYERMKQYYLDSGVDAVKAEKLAAQSAYWNLFGEAEVRATQARLHMKKDQRRQTFPEDSFDINIADAILHRY
ncbi:MAG TPA: hypothetical protein PKV80_26705 [Leptospiraceae bacterium]|nr:hypothetical protein [Leptospiraceae bacterium]